MTKNKHKKLKEIQTGNMIRTCVFRKCTGRQNNLPWKCKSDDDKSGNNRNNNKTVNREKKKKNNKENQ